MSSKLLHDYNCLQTGSKNVINQFEFCRSHTAEQIIIPEGIKKGYPPNIDFTKLPERIYKFKEELHNICKKKSRSYYRDAIMQIYHSKGKMKAKSSMSVMARCETVQVILFINFVYFNVKNLFFLT